MKKYLVIKPFEPADAIELAADAVEKNIRWVCLHAEINANCGIAYTLYDPTGTKRLAAAGIRHKPNGSGEVWVILKKEVVHYKLSLLRSIRTMLEILKLENGYKWLRTHSEIGFPESQRLLEHLGFKQMRTIMKNTHYYYRMEA